MDDKFKFMKNYKAVSDFIFVSDEISKADVIVIPGSSRKELAERATELLKAGMAPYVIVSGSTNAKLDVTEAEYLGNLMIEMGCNPSQIIQEREATNTYENAVKSFAKCLEYGIEPSKIIIVCKNYHSRRVQLTFQNVFRDSEIMISSVCDSNNITRDNWYQSEEKRAIVFGEVEKIGKYMQRAFE